MSTFNFSPNVLNWAANNVGISWEVLADEIVTANKKREEKLKDAYRGILTISQAEKVAQRTLIPFGFLFLDSPPIIEKVNIPDLRTIQNKLPLSNNFYDTLNDVQRKIDWYKEYLKNIDELNKLSFVKKFELTKNLSVEKVAEDIRATLGIDTGFIKSTRKDNYYSKLVHLIENIGVFVFTNGVVKNNSTRKLNTDEFRGFALSDEYAPAVFVNNADALSAQIFTLMHEVAHLWIGESGVSNLESDSSIEIFCNKVAAEFLMPTKQFKIEWNKNPIEDNQINIISNMAIKFMVSEFAIGIKAFQLGLVSQNTLDEIRKLSMMRHSANKNANKKGGNFYATLPVRNSKKFVNTIINQAMSQKILLRDAASLLNTKPNTIVQLYSKQESR